MNDVRLRFAPSPTGYLHVGGARTALYNYLYSQKQKGCFILRAEDTDRERSSAEFLEKQLEDLKWLGLGWDEGVMKSGDYGPYQQSQRLDIYQKYAQTLIEQKKAYYCLMTDEELEKQKSQLEHKGSKPQSPYRNQNITKEQALEKGNFTIRFRVPEEIKIYDFFDHVRKNVSLSSDMVGDFVLIRSNGLPVYNFCCVIDDYEMKISHVLRSEEHLSNTLRQLIIYEALNWKPPQWAHLSIILGDNRQKLSKRHGATSCYEMKKNGYLPEALINSLALLGWSHPEGKEILNKQELIDSFSLERVQASPAVFDLKKLNWLNAQHLWHTSQSEKEVFEKKIKPYFEEFFAVEFEEQNEKVSLKKEGASLLLDPVLFVTTCKAVAQTLQEVYDVFEICLKEDLNLNKEDEMTREVLSWPETKDVIEEWGVRLSALESSFLEKEEFLTIQKQIQEKFQVKGKKLFMPLRLSIIGKPQGFEIKEIVPLIEISKLKKKAQYVCQHL